MKTRRTICAIAALFTLAVSFGCDAMYSKQYLQQRNQQQRRVVSVPPGVPFVAVKGVVYDMEKVPATIDLSKFSEGVKNGSIFLMDPDEKATLTTGKVYVLIPGLRRETMNGKKVVFVGPGETKYIEHDCVYVLAGGQCKVPDNGDGGMNLLIGKDQYGRNTVMEYPNKVINYQPPMEIGGVQTAMPPEK